MSEDKKDIENKLPPKLVGMGGWIPTEELCKAYSVKPLGFPPTEAELIERLSEFYSDIDITIVFPLNDACLILQRILKQHDLNIRVNIKEIRQLEERNEDINVLMAESKGQDARNKNFENQIKELEHIVSRLRFKIEGY